MLTSGNVLVEGNSSRFYEFNGSTFVPTLFSNGGSLLVLPTGQILVGGAEVYNSTGTYLASWQPVITSVPSTITRGQSYLISGVLFNGLSQANAFGDEYQTNTNYPLVRITNIATGHIFYAKTHDHSSMAVASRTPVSTHFDVPPGMETGASTLVVVANGIPSIAANITVN